MERNLFIKWIGAFIAALLVGLITGTGSIIWGASALNSEVSQQGDRLGKIEQQLGQLIQRIDQGGH